MATDWWDEIAASPQLAGTRIAELVDGLELIGAQPIPYGRLPTRARTVYSADFSVWSDLADQTITTLVARPKGGAATVRALIAAARDAAATAKSIPEPGAGGDDAASAVMRLLDRLSERDRIMLSARVWAVRPQTIDQVARSLGVSTVSIVRNQPKAEIRFRELLAEPVHRDVVAHARELRRRLGQLVRDHTAKAVLRELGLDLSSEQGLMLLHVAGPYRCRDSWLEDTSTGGLSAASTTLNAAFARWAAPSTAALVRELAAIGLAPDVALDFVESQPRLRRIGDKWVRWGGTVADKAEAVLHVSAAPASAELIAAAIGENCATQAVREALFGDPRFRRATRQTWALSAWGLPEYAGVFSEIAKRVDAAGGVISVEDVVADMKAAFPDVAEVSVRTYLTNAPGFVTKAGVVRRRTAADGWPPVPPLNMARGVFSNGNEIRLALPVTRDVLRGSEQHIPPAVARALGVTPGQQRQLSSAHGHIRITWRLTTTHGPSVGSLRPLAATLDAQQGDTIVLVFDLRHNVIGAALIKAAQDPHSRLQALLGKPVPDRVSALAGALGCTPGEVASILRDRGDNEILQLLEHPVPQ